MNQLPEQPRDPSLSRLYQANAPGEPPPHLDRSILAAARAAAKPIATRRAPWWRRLRTPIALAATVMLAVMLSLSVERNPPQVDKNVVAPRPERAAPEAPTTGDASCDIGKPAPPPAREAKTPAAPAPTAKPQAAPTQLPAVRDEAPASAPPPAAVGGAASAEAESARESRSKLAAPADRAAKQETATPEAWLDEIRVLRRQGRLEEADRRLQEFRRVFPNHPLPADLR